jgi:hypothetical protein
VIQEFADRAPGGFCGPGFGLADQVLELGEQLLDRVAMMPLNDCFL